MTSPRIRVVEGVIVCSLIVTASSCSTKNTEGDPDDGASDISPDTAQDTTVVDTVQDTVSDVLADTLVDTAEDELDAPLDPAVDPDEEELPGDVLEDVPPPEMHFYYGNFHAHTGYSDGEGDPAAVFAWARDVAGYDFLAVTDHSEQISSVEWDQTAMHTALATTSGVFVALRGFEWSNPLLGHSNTFATTDNTNTISSALLSTYYSWVDDNDGLAQFNHPGREIAVFNNFAYSASVADNFFAVEVANKGDSIAEGEYLPYYIQALDNGWRLAPTANQDSHSMDTNCHRSVFVASELTGDSLLDAMVMRRIYATDDPNIGITFKVNDTWMGSYVLVPSGTAIFTVHVEDDEPIELLELVTSGGTIVSSHVPPAGSMDVVWEPSVTVSSGAWYFLKVTATDTLDDEPPVQLAVTAPIWIL